MIISNRQSLLVCSPMLLVFFVLLLAIPDKGHGSMGWKRALAAKQDAALAKRPHSKRQIASAEKKASLLADALLEGLRGEIISGKSQVPIVSDVNDFFNYKCPAPIWESKVPALKISGRNKTHAAWPGNFNILVKAFSDQVNPLAIRNFSRNYNVHAGEGRLEDRINTYKYDVEVDIEGAEFLLADGRTILSLRAEYRRSMPSHFYGKNHKGGFIDVDFKVSLLDVRGLPARWWVNRSLVGNGPIDTEVRKWGAKLCRSVNAEYLSPGAPSSARGLEELGLALAEKRWERLDVQFEDAKRVLAAALSEQNNNAYAQRRQMNSEVRAQAARDRAAVMAGIAEGAQNVASSFTADQARYARIRSQAERFHGVGAFSSRESSEETGNSPESDGAGGYGLGRPEPISQARGDSTGHTARGTSNLRSPVKKDDLRPHHQQEACEVAKENARLHHALDPVAQQSIQYGSCSCKELPAQMLSDLWVYGCDLEYTVNVAPPRDSNSSGASSR